MMNKSVALMTFALALSCFGCAGSAAKVSHDIVQPDASENTVDPIAHCAEVWNLLLKEWEANGGGIKDSMAATKQQIVNDKKSVFAEGVRQVWVSNKNLPRGFPMWVWPIPVEYTRNSVNLLSDALEDEVGPDCLYPTLLDPLIWNHIRFVDGDPLKYRVLAEAPADVAWSPRRLSHWIVDWLLVPPSDEVADADHETNVSGRARIWTLVPEPHEIKDHERKAESPGL